MGILSNIVLVQAVRPNQIEPIISKRAKFSLKIQEQIQAATAFKNGDSFSKKVAHWVTDLETDVRKAVEVERRISPWWWMDKDGKYLLTLRYGTKKLELAKGKSAVQCQSLDHVIEVLESLKRATAEGEMDPHLQQASEQIRRRFKHSK